MPVPTPGGVPVRNVAHPVIKQAYNVYQLLSEEVDLEFSNGEKRTFELLMSSGLGAVIINSANNFDSATMFVPIIILMLMGRITEGLDIVRVARARYDVLLGTLRLRQAAGIAGIGVFVGIVYAGAMFASLASGSFVERQAPVHADDVADVVECEDVGMIESRRRARFDRHRGCGQAAHPRHAVAQAPPPGARPCGPVGPAAPRSRGLKPLLWLRSTPSSSSRAR